MYRTIDKYWGIEDWIQVTNEYAFKRLNVNAGNKILNHYHEIKEETFYVASGEGVITINGVPYSVKDGDHLHIYPNDRHEVYAITDMIILEASTPYLTDSIREVE
jgi:quercetin dioxygenase-like cupin family protein